MTLHVVSCIASNYVPFARVLADSVREHHTDARVSVLVVDPRATALGDEPFEVLTPAAIGVDRAELGHRALAYDTQGLVSSLKARMLGWALRDGGGQPVLLLDADVLVCGDLAPLAEEAARAGVLLSPHSSRPIAHRRGGGSAEECFLRAGAYNGGFVGVGRGGGGDPALLGGEGDATHGGSGGDATHGGSGDDATHGGSEGDATHGGSEGDAARGGGEGDATRAGGEGDAARGGGDGAGGLGAAFCAWWDERCARDCLRDAGRRLLLSQAWLDLVPAMFGAAVTRDPGVNVTGHNLHGRDVVDDGERWRIEGAPLRCFHFSSFDPARPDRLGTSTEASWCDLDGRPGVAALTAEYAARLRGRGFTADRPIPGFTALEGGLGITPAMRRAYLDGLLAFERGDEDAPPPNPLLGDDRETFLRWLGDPAAAVQHAWLSRYLLATHRVRDDLRRTWPDVPGSHTEPYLVWCRDELPSQDPAWTEIRMRR